MGVIRFFHHLTQKWSSCLIKLNGDIESCESAKSQGVDVDWLELDLNSIYHPVAQSLYKYGQKPDNKPISFLRQRKEVAKPLAPIIPEEELFKEICKRIENMRKILSPSVGIYFATDGISGVSKTSQQRKRRFKSCKDASNNNEKSLFDSSSISTGTLFMKRLSKYTNDWVKEEIKINSEWKKLTIIIDDDSIFGEGEHKLIHHMKLNPQYSYVVVSPDADLIFLTLGLHNPKVWIFRENIFDNIPANFFLVDIFIFRECVLKEIKLFEKEERNELVNKFNITDAEITNRIIEDFIVFTISIGNDFLPQIPTMEIANDGIEVILSIYPKVIKEYGFLTNKQEGVYNFNKQSLKQLFYELSQLEYDMLINNYRNSRSKWPNTILKQYVRYNIVTDNIKYGQPERQLVIDFKGYRNEYYNKKFNNINIETIIHEYLKGMLFVQKYYLDTIPSYTWSYPFHYSPFFIDMFEHIDTFDVEMKFEPSEPFTPLEQLLAVLPGKSAYLLPEPLRFLSNDLNSPIIDMFPIDFDVDLEGKKQEYEGVILLCHVCPMRLKKAFKKVEHLLSDYDKERNKPGKIIIYNN
jgi:5'-3' exoribonuclease 1